METLLHALVLFALALPQDSAEPALPPRIELTGFTGIEAGSYEDLFGRAVLIDFFASWCAPCARQVPHLNDLQERYAERGLVVLGVTGQERPVIEPWIEEHGVAFPYAFDPDLRLQIDLGFHPLPFAILLDATGTVVWSGKADQLGEPALERALEGTLARPVPSWPESAAGVRSALAGHRYAAALTALEGLADAALREEVDALVRRLLESRARVAEAALERGDLLTANDVASALVPASAGLELQERFAAIQERVVREDDGLLEAQTELRKRWRTVHRVATKEAADALLAELRAFSEAYPGTFVEIQAARYQAAVENVRMTLR